MSKNKIDLLLSIPKFGKEFVFKGAGKRAYAFDPSLVIGKSQSLSTLPRKDQVVVHTMNKADAHAKVFIYTYKMNQLGLFDWPSNAGKVVTTTGARLQLQKGNTVEGTEGAHCFSCNAQVNSLNIFDYLAAYPSMPQQDLRGQFGRTDVVDKVINKADTLLENTGMVDLTRRTLQGILYQPIPVELKPKIGELQSVYFGFRHGSLIVHDLAIRKLEQQKKARRRSATEIDEEAEIIEQSRELISDHVPEFMDIARLIQFSKDFDEEIREKWQIVPYKPNDNALLE